MHALPTKASASVSSRKAPDGVRAAIWTFAPARCPSPGVFTLWVLVGLSWQHRCLGPKGAWRRSAGDLLVAAGAHAPKAPAMAGAMGRAADRKPAQGPAAAASAGRPPRGA